MTQMISELYDALKAAGVDDDRARRAAQAVMAIETKTELATKTDIALVRSDLAKVKADLITWIVGLLVGAMGVQTAVIAVILRTIVP
jgi:hypothetical protein